MKRVALVAVALLAACSASSAAVPDSGRARATITFIGDSNITLGATQIAGALTDRDDPYALVLLARAGTWIRSSNCELGTNTCTDGDFWKTRLAVLSSVKSDGFVIDLGINDAGGPGKATIAGYGDYGAKIDWLLRLLPKGVPVWWSNLPCSLEPADRLAGCKAINAALATARARWSNLTVLPWAARAVGHPEFMRTVAPPAPQIHYSSAGYVAWSALVVKALDARFP